MNQHEQFTAPAPHIAHRENIADAHRELDCAEAEYREGNGAKALYHLLRANGSLGVATGIAAMNPGFDSYHSAESERVSLGNKILAFYERITTIGAVKRCLCNCVTQEV